MQKGCKNEDCPLRNAGCYLYVFDKTRKVFTALVCGALQLVKKGLILFLMFTYHYIC